MTETPVQHRDYYVYALFREDGATPFYIGKGRGNRIDIHERQAHRFTSHKDRIIQNMRAAGVRDIPKAKLIEGLTDPEAKDIEVTLIYLLGRWPHGPLANLTNGGDGVSDLSPESKAKQTAANVRSWADPIVRKKRSDGMKAAWTDEKRADHGVKMIEIKTPEVRAKMSAGRKAAATRPEVMATVKRAASDPAARHAKSIAMKRNWQDPKIRAMRSAASKKHQSRPEYRELRSRIAKEIWRKRKNQYALPSQKDAES